MLEYHDIYTEIPGVPSCHCSSLIILPTNELLCGFFAGQYEKAADVSIWGSRLSLNTKEVQWNKPEIVIKEPNRSMGSPVWYLTPQNKLYLFYHVLHHGRIIKPGWSDANIQYIISEDYGKTWNQPHFLRKMWFWILRCAPVVTNINTVLLPVHREMFQYQSMVYINSKIDLTGKWRRYGRFKTPHGCDEPSIIKFPDGELLCSLRTQDKCVYFCRSSDHGVYWTKPEPSNLPNPNSQTCLLLLNSGRLIIIYNPTTQGRSPLSISWSTDRGKTWAPPKDLENDPGKEFSYPSVVQTSDNLIHLTYTYHRKKIRYVRFNEAWIGK